MTIILLIAGIAMANTPTMTPHTPAPMSGILKDFNICNVPEIGTQQQIQKIQAAKQKKGCQ